MTSIENINDNFIRRVLSETANAATFLKVTLPDELQKQLDLTDIVLDPTSYISEAYKESLSDMVFKCKTQAEETPVDVYVLFEHKSHQDKKVLMQLLRYMYLMLQKDSDERKSPRAIIPLVFYHGKDPWRIPTQFAQQFTAPEAVKRFLLNYEYILFDTNQWDWESESSRPLKENLFLLSAMILMKAAYQQNIGIIRQVFQLWNQMGFVQEQERINFLMIYIAETQDVRIPELKKMLEESKIEGEETMPTLAQRLREEGRALGYLLDRQEVLTMLLATRFQVTEAEKQLIATVKEADKLNDALKLVVTADTKEKVLGVLKTV